MEIQRRAHGEFLELVVEGRLDGYWAQHLSSTIDEVIREGTHGVRVNLANASYISSAGIGVLVDMHKRLAAVEGTFAVVEPSRQVRQILEMVGLAPMLLEGRAAASPQAAPAADTRRKEAGGILYEVHGLTPDAHMTCRMIGKPEPLASSAFSNADCRPIALEANCLALGLGAFGDGFEHCRDRFGEFLAVAGAGAFQPTDGTNFPDYMMASGSFVPRISALYALCCEGAFSQLVRFEGASAGEAVSLSMLAEQCLEAAGTESAAMVILAESAGLMGAALKRSPVDRGNGATRLFGHPEIRRWLSFSPERCYAHALVLLVGVVSKTPPPEVKKLLRPMRKDSAIAGHFHAAAFAYRPLQKGRLELKTAVRGLFEAGGLESVLHALSDDRGTGGAGESELRRGACWVAPIREFSQQEPGL